MITINYNNGREDNPFSEPIKIFTGELDKIFTPDQLPLTFEIKSSLTGNLVWSVELSSNCWATYPRNELNDVIVKDNTGKIIEQYLWSVMKDGSLYHKSLWLYCKNLTNQGKFPIGLVIGTHDGEFGEWVPIVMNSMSEVTLVEGSLPQYNKLIKNYPFTQNVTFINDLITTDGKDVIFYEGGKGYTNSVVERVTRSWETEEIRSTKMTSTSINDLIENKLNGHIDWLHLDVEGLDAKLIMSLEDKHLPGFMIFEVNNLLEGEKDLFFRWLTSKKYSSYTDSSGIGMASKII
jgi:hypothetical protein